MGYYGTTCSNCGGPAIFFSFSMSVECSNCRSHYEFVSLLAAWTAKVAYDEANVMSTCVSVDVPLLSADTSLLPPAE